VVSALTDAGIGATGCSIGSMWGVFFAREPVHSFEEAQGADLDTFRAFHRACLDRGVFLAPSAFEAGFVSTAHTTAVIDETLEVVRAAALEVA
jgi:glutamate-1-semialdehyde 2,1-aminomutase